MEIVRSSKLFHEIKFLNAQLGLGFVNTNERVYSHPSLSH